MNKYSDLGERIRRVRKGEKLSQAAFGKLFNCGIALMNRIENGHNKPDADLILGIKEKFGVDLNWLMTGLGDPDEKNAMKVSVPLMSMDLENIDGFISLPGLPKGCKAVRIFDESMLPVIRSGDIIVYSKRNSEMTEGCLVLYESRWGEVKVSRYSSKDRKLYAEEPDIPPREINEDLVIHGRVVQVIRQITL